MIYALTPLSFLLPRMWVEGATAILETTIWKENLRKVKQQLKGAWVPD